MNRPEERDWAVSIFVFDIMEHGTLVGDGRQVSRKFTDIHSYEGLTEKLHTGKSVTKEWSDSSAYLNIQRAAQNHFESIVV